MLRINVHAQGKPIDACFILHRFLVNGRTQRVLNAVSESLVHYLFVELFRKFNILADIFDEGRCLSIETHLSETSRKDKLSVGEVNSFLVE